MIPKAYRTYVLLAVIMIFAFVMIAVTKSMAHTGEEVVISVDGKDIKRLPLNKDTEYTVSETGEAKDGRNTIVIKDGNCYMESANCPDKLCIEQGRILKSGEAIICLPHRLVVTIEGEEDNTTDTIAK